MSAAKQLGLFESPELGFDPAFRELQHIELDAGAWVELVPSWLQGDGVLFDELVRNVEWRTEDRVMYTKKVDVPRMYGTLPERGVAPGIVREMQRALDARYETSFSRVSLAYYRDGGDSVAWHGDYVARRMERALVATVSLGEPRRFAIRPAGGGRSVGWRLGRGDLMVMGGSCQRTHQHAVPKVAKAGPRIALMLRPVWKE